MEPFDLAKYLTNCVENIVKNILRAILKDPRESAFMLKYSAASREASKRRAACEAEGEHIPPFLIASITSSCNLHCAGCYARHIDRWQCKISYTTMYYCDGNYPHCHWYNVDCIEKQTGK